MIERKHDPRLTRDEDWKILVQFVEGTLQILKDSDDHKKSENVNVSATAAAVTIHKELVCSGWTVEQVLKWADEKGLNFLLKPYD